MEKKIINDSLTKAIYSIARKESSGNMPPETYLKLEQKEIEIYGLFLQGFISQCKIRKTGPNGLDYKIILKNPEAVILNMPTINLKYLEGDPHQWIFNLALSLRMSLEGQLINLDDRECQDLVRTVLEEVLKNDFLTDIFT